MQKNIDIPDGSFRNFIFNQTWWWVPILLTSFLLFVGESSQTIFSVNLVWLVYKVVAWKRLSPVKQVLSAKSKKSIRTGSKVILLLISVVIGMSGAYIPSQLKDAKVFYHDIPYQAAIDSGYTPSDADRMTFQIVNLMPHNSEDIFLTSTGEFWFFILTYLYSWRLYILLTKIVTLVQNRL
ncbi:hypothetical protein FEMY_24600 [Ferrovum myxofaciens]|uniref:Uncharacterized protein n=1 Tax=Ferrovum myxofaciens TaxID=416213 RepID=A0A149VVR7_9PROT|nr:hypothetical protein [Ferrovum myxofaciens]KXW57024.1 hypothetical protein FEMY_24600 [Ferrovum myxofaciens]